MSRTPIWYASTLWVIKYAMWFPWVRRNRRDAMDRLRKKPGYLAGDGAWKVHAVFDTFRFQGVCQQPVGSVGGSREDVDCRACKRILRKVASR